MKFGIVDRRPGSGRRSAHSVDTDKLLGTVVALAK